MKGRYAIKRLAKKNRRNARDLIVLAEFSDPFYVGSKTQYAHAEWARELYYLLKPQQTVHIRRLHYFALTQPQHLKPNGNIYTNTNANWKFLGYAFKFARYLNLLPYDVFSDRRNPFQPEQKWMFKTLDTPGQWQEHIKERIEKLCRLYLRLMLTRVLPVHIEIWVEKSTAADLLTSIAEEYNINIITSMGDVSITAVWNFIDRIADLTKPIRIFYISDFDPEGENMPIGVARKIEFLLRQYKLSRTVDVKLKPLILTRWQCKKFQLPGTPLSEKPVKSRSFAKYHGRTTIELHALEVASPGYIAGTVKEYLERYLDLTKIAHLKKSLDDVITRLLHQIEHVIETNTDLSLIFEITERLFTQSAPVYDSEYNEPWLFDSHRDYMSQLATYYLQKLR